MIWLIRLKEMKKDKQKENINYAKEKVYGKC